jgi:hypothetical protein
MSYLYFTIVKASPEFLKKLIMKQIDIEMSFKILNDKDDEIIITTTNRSALDKVISLSIKYPEEVFYVKIAGEDIYENYITMYKCSNGDLKPLKEGFEYCFVIKPSDRDKLDEDVFNTFKQKVCDIYNRIAQTSRNKVKLNFDFDDESNDEEESNLLVTIEYTTPNARLIAKKYGVTYINVDIEFFDKKEISSKSEKELKTEYDDVPF